MKAWRLEAQAINARREAGSKEPTARVQKNIRMSAERMTKTAGNFLLNGLLIHGGYATPHPYVKADDMVYETEGKARGWVLHQLMKGKSWWSK